jgi:hypothetical protein
MPPKRLPPIHPGEILLEEYLRPWGISEYRLAKEITSARCRSPDQVPRSPLGARLTL